MREMKRAFELTCWYLELPSEDSPTAAETETPVSAKRSKKDKKKKRKSLLETEAEPTTAQPTAESLPGVQEGDNPNLASGVTAPPENTDSTTEPVTSGAVSAEPEPITPALAAGQQQPEPLISREPDLEPTP